MILILLTESTQTSFESGLFNCSVNFSQIFTGIQPTWIALSPKLTKNLLRRNTHYTISKSE